MGTQIHRSDHRTEQKVETSVLDGIIVQVKNPGVDLECAKWKVLVAQPCLTLCDPMDCSPPGSSVCGILQARILEWIAIPFSKDLSDPGIKPRSPALHADSLPSEPQEIYNTEV